MAVRPGEPPVQRPALPPDGLPRGKDWANVYADPTASPDSGFVEVAGKVGEGINLDGDPRTGFASPAGEKGVDNRFYKALGCWKFYRGAAGESPSFVTANNRMRDGGWTMVVVVSGAGDDPMNDDQVRMGVFMSADTLVKDGTGNVAKDYTFRIRPHADYEALFEGKIANGRLTTAATPRAFLRDAGFGRGLELLQARADLQLQADGTLKGYIGGYRPFQAIFEGFLDHHGWTIESNTGVELPALWYALRRNADYSPTGPLGPKTHISFALRVQAAPAYVTDPEGQGLVSGVKSYRAAAPAGEGLMRYPPRPPGYRVVDGLVTPASGAPAAPLTAEELTRLATHPRQVAATAKRP
ncbi:MULTISPECIES: hypothetical protein [unclassified Phenylobacterium]|uniref:hypothetical protein n=1 Tax=unclassified Phenylobacterium TaxID=2640670 RepID=UPI0012E73E6C|nr:MULTISPECIES: hypothetical protein [unclassified Phenylobacterium]